MEQSLSLVDLTMQHTVSGLTWSCTFRMVKNFELQDQKWWTVLKLLADFTAKFKEISVELRDVE